jgi:DNA-binding CsgD family transcriptional regulator
VDPVVDDYPRLLRVLADVGDPLTLAAFRERVLDALATRLDLRRLTFFLGTAPGPDVALWSPAVLGVRDGLAEAYRERFQADDVFLTAGAQALLRRTGVVSMTDVLAGGTTPGGERFVEEFLAPQRVGGYLAVWLDTRLPVHGYLAVLAGDQARLTAADRARLAVLRVHLAQLLRLHVATDPAAVRPPAPVAAPRLTAREQELARLVAAGLSNREIAAALVLSEDTVKKYVSRLMGKLGVARRGQVAAAWPAP